MKREMKQIFKKGVFTLTTVFCLAAASCGTLAEYDKADTIKQPKKSELTVPITREKLPNRWLQGLGAVMMIAAGVITYKIARMETHHRVGPY